jgi:hypothetical protein
MLIHHSIDAFFPALKRHMTCHAIYWQKARTKTKDIDGSDRLTGGCVCQRVKEQFVSKIWSIQLAFLFFTLSQLLLPALPLCNTSTFQINSHSEFCNLVINDNHATCRCFVLLKRTVLARSYCTPLFHIFRCLIWNQHFLCHVRFSGLFPPPVQTSSSLFDSARNTETAANSYTQMSTA